jgi:hypothetical protein
MFEIKKVKNKNNLKGIYNPSSNKLDKMFVAKLGLVSKDTEGKFI